MIRTELHAHTSDDRHDRLPHTARDLIVRAGALGYGALAITLHDSTFEPAPLAAFAREHGVRLVRGCERTVLLLNYPADAIRAIRRLDDLAAIKAAHPDGLVVAPHPFYPIPSALGRDNLETHRALWDAVEVNAMHVRGLDWNRQAVAWAEAHGVPLVGNGDVHRLSQLGRTWSDVDVDVPPTMSDTDAAAAICGAIRAGRVQVRTTPIAHWRAALLFVQMSISGTRGRLSERRERRRS
jgi:predicted metal-dependent phosphoesterase TrpH